MRPVGMTERENWAVRDGQKPCTSRERKNDRDAAVAEVRHGSTSKVSVAMLNQILASSNQAQSQAEVFHFFLERRKLKLAWTSAGTVSHIAKDARAEQNSSRHHGASSTGQGL